MKVMRMDSKDVVIFLPNPTFSLNKLSKDELEEYFRSLFLKLEERYEINRSGFYQIDIYHDSHYGIVLEIMEEEVPYFDYLDGEVEMNIHIKKDTFFLYKIKDILDLDKEIIIHSNLYYFENEFYLELTSNITFKSYLQLLEYGELIYGDQTKKIQRFGKLFHKSLC